MVVITNARIKYSNENTKRTSERNGSGRKKTINVLELQSSLSIGAASPSAKYSANPKPRCFNTERDYLLYEPCEARFVRRSWTCLEMWRRDRALLWYSLSVLLFLLYRFCEMTKNEFAAFVLLLEEQLRTSDRPLANKTKIQFVSSTYTASCRGTSVQTATTLLLVPAYS